MHIFCGMTMSGMFIELTSATSVTIDYNNVPDRHLISYINWFIYKTYHHIMMSYFEAHELLNIIVFFLYLPCTIIKIE